jgi:hypothetical protein
MVWRAAVEGEARMFAGRGGFFASSGAPWLPTPWRGPRLSAGFWDPLSWVCDHSYSLFASRFAN